MRNLASLFLPRPSPATFVAAALVGLWALPTQATAQDTQPAPGGALGQGSSAPQRFSDGTTQPDTVPGETRQAIKDAPAVRMGLVPKDGKVKPYLPPPVPAFVGRPESPDRLVYISDGFLLLQPTPPAKAQGPHAPQPRGKAGRSRASAPVPLRQADVPFIVHNVSDKDQLLVSVTSPLCQKVRGDRLNQELAGAPTGDDVFSHLVIPRQATMVFALNDYHLVCEGLSPQVGMGTMVPFQFNFADGRHVTAHFTLHPAPGQLP
ncbi:copper chaperone PCu(A)C [Formicincola oecophyllae]|nr:copper chaperone PCu(A)C [Formicincola oecophyllae]